MPECLSCGKEFSSQRLCRECCKAMLRGVEASVAIRRRYVERLPPLFRSMASTPSNAEAFGRLIRVLRLLRYLAVGAAGYLIVLQSTMVSRWTERAGRFKLSEAVVITVVILIVAAGLVVGMRIGRQLCRSFIRMYATLTDRATQPFLVQFGATLRRFVCDPVHLLLTLGPLLIALFFLLLTWLPRRSPWLVPGFLTGLALIDLAVWIAIGAGVGVFHYGDWIEACARGVRELPQ